MSFVQSLIVALGVLVLVGATARMLLRASGRTGPPVALVSPTQPPDAPADEPAHRRQTQRVEQATIRSARIHRDTMRLTALRLDALDATIGAQQRRKAGEERNHDPR